jgi:hypothetical protein
MNFSNLPYEERVYAIEGALAGVLAELTHPAPTDLVVGRVARALGHDDKDTRKSVAGVVMKLAPKHPNARHEGSTFVRFGRLCQRWIWTPGRPEESEGVEIVRLKSRESDDEASERVNSFMPEDWRTLTAKQLAYVDVKLSPAQQREWASPENTKIRADRAARIAGASAAPAGDDLGLFR